MDRNPQLGPGLDALVCWLVEANYSEHALGRIRRHVAVHGTLAGSIVEPEDEAGAEEAFTAALPELAWESDAWSRDDQVVTIDLVAAARGEHPLPFAEPEPDSEEQRAFYDAWLQDREVKY
jgi:hypothetical protein